MGAVLGLLLSTSCVQGWSGSVVSPSSRLSAARCSSIQMGTVKVADFEGSSLGEAEVNLKVAKGGAYVVHRKIVAEQANVRLGTACTKTRAEVRGGGRKPYQQKGTGRARRGSSRSPLIRGGGVTFGPKPRSFKIKLNRKEKRVAISTALMSAVPRMTLLKDFESNFEAPKTKNMVRFLERLKVDVKKQEKTLMIVKDYHKMTFLSAGNIPYLNVLKMGNINARDIVNARKVFVSDSAMEVMKERYSPRVPLRASA